MTNLIPSAIFNGLQSLALIVDTVIATVQERTSEELREIAANANQLANAGYRIRGCVGAEWERRLGPQDGHTIGKQLSELAKEIGVGPKTLRDDIKIFKTFGEKLNDTPLDREYYRQAVYTDDPEASIDLAFNQKAVNASYNVRDFAADIKKVKSGATVEAVESGQWVHVFVTAENSVGLRKLQDRKNKSIEGVINQLIADGVAWMEGK